MKIRKHGVFVLFILIFIFSFLTIPLFAAEEKIKPAEQESMEEKVSPEIIERPSIEYKAGDLRDPFQNPSEEEAVSTEEPAAPETREVILPSFTVQGLIWGGNFPQAIINNKVVKIGDTIQGVRIISIDKEGITLFFEGKQYNLPSPAATGTAHSKKPQGGQNEKDF